MFNLENKITWKELAPSLQAMFKTLQSQITDVKNEVNNINISLGDINDHLENIDNSIKEINTTIENNYNELKGDITNINENMTTIIKDTVEDMKGEMMFLNLAPKIGYYQEDKIEVISKYNMNNYERNSQGGSIMFYDNMNRYIYLFLGNDGSYNQSSTCGIYKGYTSNLDVDITYINEPVDLSHLGYPVPYYIWFQGSDDEYIALKIQKGYARINTDTSYKLLLINTHNSMDESTWTLDKDLTDWILWNNKVNITNKTVSNDIKHVYYLKEYGTIIIITAFIIPSNDVTHKAFSYFLVINHDSLELMQAIELKHPFEFVYCIEDYSFSKNNHITHYTDEGATISNNAWGWDGNGNFYLYKKYNRLMFITKAYVDIWNWHTKIQTQEELQIKVMYEIPNEVLKGTSNNITCITNTNGNTTRTVYGYSNNSIYGTYPNIQQACGNNLTKNILYPFYDRQFKNICYSTNRNEIFILSNIRDNNYNCRYVTVVNVDDAFDDSLDDNRKGSWNTTKYTGRPYLVPPDASLYGKQIRKFVFAWDKMMISACSNKGYVELLIDEFEWVPGTEDSEYPVIQPVAGKICSIVGNNWYTGLYNYMDKKSASIFGIVSNYKGYYCSSSDVYGAYNNNNSLWSSAKMSDGSVRLFMNASDKTIIQDGQYTSAIEVKSNGKESTEFKFLYSEAACIKIPNGFSSACRTVFGSDNYRMYSCFYNPIGNYFLYFGRSLDNYKLGFIILKSDGTIKPFTTEYVSSVASGYFKTFLTNVINVGNSMQCCRLNAVEYYSANDAVLHLYYSYANTQNVYAINCNIHFGNDYTTISFTNNDSSPQREFEYAPDSFKLHYSGNKYGWCAQGNGYKYYPAVFRTQKPIQVRNLPSKYTQKTYNDTDSRDNIYNNCNTYYMYLQSSQGLVAYIPSIPIFLGGYFSIIENPIPVTLQPNSDNYIYIERDSNDRTNIIASSSTTRTINEGDKVFNKILCAKVTTDSANMISVEYYRINTGYNDYSFN